MLSGLAARGIVDGLAARLRFEEAVEVRYRILRAASSGGEHPRRRQDEGD
jgi:hypothetical protein